MDQTGHVFISRDVIFDEHSFLNLLPTLSSSQQYVLSPSLTILVVSNLSPATSHIIS